MALLVPLQGISSIAGSRHVTTGRIITGNFNCSSVKEAKVSKLRNNINNVGWLYGQFSAPVKPTDTASFASKKGKEKEEESRNYYVNTGYAIRTLRDEFPELFYRELSFDIYRYRDLRVNVVGFCRRLYYNDDELRR
ncbi:uncharacterized protein Fot_17817 [Forsythia ovata]|uniref:Uncharacterized protein n=1 Tax=Forsythia ovata TaxID=205694 RepID=A0ABD1VGF6_9LAMI